MKQLLALCILASFILTPIRAEVFIRKIDPDTTYHRLWQYQVIRHQPSKAFYRLDYDVITADAMELLLMKMGVALPLDSKVMLVDGELTIHTDEPIPPEERERLTAVTKILATPVPRVDILASVIGFSEDTLNELSASDFPGIPETEALIKLARANKGTIYERFKAQTYDGGNFDSSAVSELIYPTEFDVSENDINIKGGSSLKENSGLPFIPPTVIPGAFETRDIGIVFQALPTILPAGDTLSLLITTEITSVKEWNDYGTSFSLTELKHYEAPMRQPVINSIEISANGRVQSGEITVHGGQRDPETGLLLFLFVQATIAE